MMPVEYQAKIDLGKRTSERLLKDLLDVIIGGPQDMSRVAPLNQCPTSPVLDASN
jgi:hypothetical protein